MENSAFGEGSDGAATAKEATKCGIKLRGFRAGRFPANYWLTTGILKIKILIGANRSTPSEHHEVDVPTGNIKFYDAERGFGFIATDDGDQVFLHASALPQDAPAPKPGARVEFGVADGRKGPQALSVKYLDPIPSVARAQRKPAEELAVMVEDVIRLLDSLGNQLRRGRYPEKATASKTAIVLRGIADSIEA